MNTTLSEERLQCIEADMLKPGHMPCESCRTIVRELIAAVRGTIPMSSTTVSETCDRPPAGWACTRQRGHEGPSAAVPRDVVLVSDPSAGPRDRFNALAEKLVASSPGPKDIVKALKDVYWEGHRDGDREAKATWGEAVEESDTLRAFRVTKILFDDGDILRGDRPAVEGRLSDAFAEVRAVARSTQDRPSPKPSERDDRSFDEALEGHRKKMEHLCEASKIPSVLYLAKAVWFLLALAHQPKEGGVVEVGGSPEHEYTVSTLDATKRALGELEMLRGLERVIRECFETVRIPGTMGETKARTALDLIDAWRKDNP
jgi:hypothetical protein